MGQLTTDGKKHPKTEARYACGKVCKNIIGLKLHQTRSRGGDVRNIIHNVVFNGEMQEDPSQEKNPTIEGVSSFKTSMAN